MSLQRPRIESVQDQHFITIGNAKRLMHETSVTHCNQLAKSFSEVVGQQAAQRNGQVAALVHANHDLALRITYLERRTLRGRWLAGRLAVLNAATRFVAWRKHEATLRLIGGPLDRRVWLTSRVEYELSPTDDSPRPVRISLSDALVAVYRPTERVGHYAFAGIDTPEQQAARAAAQQVAVKQAKADAAEPATVPEPLIISPSAD